MNDSTTLAPTRAALHGLTASVFQHPLDRQATEQLKRLRGFDKIVAKFIEYGIERYDYITNIANSVRVGPSQLPKLHGMLLECCTMLDVPEPELYVQQGDVNAYTSGHNNPYIVLRTGLLDIMGDDEILAVLAHEVGHIKCGHMLYKQLAGGLKPLLEIVDSTTLGLGAVLSVGMEAALLTWDRRSQLSADRASLLVLQDVGPCVRMLMHLAGGSAWTANANLDAEQFLLQARSFNEGVDQRMLDRIYRYMQRTTTTHPFPVERAKALDEWASGPEYAAILAGDYEKSAAPANALFCTSCGQPLHALTKFCPGCGARSLVQ
jgi:Zn-dependent protease with chaperone function